MVLRLATGENNDTGFKRQVRLSAHSVDLNQERRKWLAIQFPGWTRYRQLAGVNSKLA
jgi:hypothetical protein